MKEYWLCGRRKSQTIVHLGTFWKALFNIEHFDNTPQKVTAILSNNLTSLIYNMSTKTFARKSILQLAV